MSKVEVYYARERPSGVDGSIVWDYVVEMNNGQTLPVGYCAGWKELTQEEYLAEFGWYDGEHLFETQESKRQWQWKYHSGGHPTQDLALLCYREFRVDQELAFSAMSPNQLQYGVPCNACDALAEFYTDFIGGDEVRYYLCALHATGEVVKMMLPLNASPRRIVFY